MGLIRGLITLVLWVAVLAAVVAVGSKLVLPDGYTVAASVLIRVSPDRVWNRIDDISQWMSWMRGVDRLDLVKGTGREAGSTGRAHIYTGFQGLDLAVQLVEVIPLRSVRYHISGGPQDGVLSTIELQATDQGRSTLVRWTESQTPGGLWGNLMARVMLSVVQTHHEESLNQLKFTLERAM